MKRCVDVTRQDCVGANNPVISAGELGVDDQGADVIARPEAVLAADHVEQPIFAVVRIVRRQVAAGRLIESRERSKGQTSDASRQLRAEDRIDDPARVYGALQAVVAALPASGRFPRPP